LPEGTDPQNPDDSENNKKTDQNKTNEPKTKTDSKSQTSASQPSSVKASTTGSASSAATSTAVSTTCTACDVCATYDYAPDATPNPMDDDSNEMRKRALAGRFIHNKRANNYASSVVGSVGSNKCPVARYTQKPQYPGPGVVANNEVNPSPDMKAFYATAIYWAVPTQPPKCGAPGWAFLSTNAIAAANSPWALGGDKKSVNVDHVCKYNDPPRKSQCEDRADDINQMRLVSWTNSSHRKLPQASLARISPPCLTRRTVPTPQAPD